MRNQPKSAILLLSVIVLITALIYLPSFDLPMRKGAINNATFPLTFGLVHNVPAFIFQIENPLSLGFIRPVSHFLLYLDFLISGCNPFGMRITHLLMHIGNLFGVYFLGVLLFRDYRWAIIAAALFAFHPNAIEAVVATLPQDLLSGFFFLWGLWGWGNYLLKKNRRKVYLAITLASLALGLLSKELFLVFPAAAFILHYFVVLEGRLPKFTFRSFKWGYLSQVVVLICYWIYRLSVLGGVGGYMGAKHFLPSLYMIPNSIRVVNGAFYIDRALGPLKLDNPLWIIATVSALTITLFGLIPRRRGSHGWMTVFAFLFMFLSAAATLNFRWLGWWYIYVPLAGFSLGIAGLLREYSDKVQKPIPVFISAGGLTVLLIVLTVFNLDEFGRRWDPKLKMYRKVGEILTQQSKKEIFLWRKHTGALMRFDLYGKPVLDPQTQALWADNKIKALYIADSCEGDLIVGYNIVPPYVLRPTPNDPLYRLTYQKLEPTLTPLDYDLFQREISGMLRLRNAKRKNK
jgi:hypothetical protein